jgi:translation initiation factor IF-2
VKGERSVQNQKEQQRQARLAEMSTSASVTLSTLASADEEADGLKRMNIIIKADATGSVEALRGALLGLPQDTVSLRFLLASTGAVTESDVDLAWSTESLLIAFNTAIPEDAEARAKQRSIQIHSYDVIYNVLDLVRLLVSVVSWLTILLPRVDESQCPRLGGPQGMGQGCECPWPVYSSRLL